ncbi:hypothetical protein HH303_01845 [Rhodospirillaceae bacterium KN72]|uniref:TetR family transcriptional regulator n=1 Tax=Pacificispira spongiicola TaxID=2729598 RepID=A0A7Y0DYM8_9PROT|nr:hypothetical protein [Pacificispira spongiicola]NMM43201.1 hypothetical protein [Pacificispira spongiicola]
MNTTTSQPSQDDIIDTAMTVIAERGVSHDAWEEVAARNACTVQVLRGHIGDLPDAVLKFLDRADRQVLSEDAGFTDEDSVKDRLFDLLMRRLDGLAPHRQAMAAISREMRRNPCLAALIGGRELRALSWYLEAAGVSIKGPFGLIRTKGLGLVWTRVFTVWLDDDSDDFAKTMATLDKDLSRAGRAASWFGPRRGGGPVQDDGGTEAVSPL